MKKLLIIIFGAMLIFSIGIGVGHSQKVREWEIENKYKAQFLRESALISSKQEAKREAQEAYQKELDELRSQGILLLIDSTTGLVIRQ